MLVREWKGIKIGREKILHTAYADTYLKYAFTDIRQIFVVFLFTTGLYHNIPMEGRSAPNERIT